MTIRVLHPLPPNTRCAGNIKKVTAYCAIGTGVALNERAEVLIVMNPQTGTQCQVALNERGFWQPDAKNFAAHELPPFPARCNPYEYEPLLRGESLASNCVVFFSDEEESRDVIIVNSETGERVRINMGRTPAAIAA